MSGPSFTYDRAAPKKAVNLSVNSDLLGQAREAGVKLSALLERALEAETRRIRQAQWREENRAAIDAYNEHVERDGVFSDGLRSF